MTTMASQITSLMVVYSTVYSDADQRKHQSSASLAFVWGIHRPGEFPAQRASYADNVSIWWRHHGFTDALCKRKAYWNIYILILQNTIYSLRMICAISFSTIRVTSHESWSVSFHLQLGGMLNRLSRLTTKELPKLCVTGPLWGNTPVKVIYFQMGIHNSNLAGELPSFFWLYFDPSVISWGLRDARQTSERPDNSRYKCRGNW